MRRKLLIVICWLTIALQLVAQNTAALIGISDYQPGSGWRAINAHNDVELIKSKLSSSWKVIVLENESATRQGITQLLNEITMTASPGDTVFIHFSCHGQQMVPLNIDNNTEPDMLDEALVPYDTYKKWSLSYDGRNHLRDDDLSSYINLIRDKVGVNGMVIVSLDACHSDCMDKDGNPINSDSTSVVYRGTADIFGDSTLITASVKAKRYIRDTSTIASDNISEVVYISACQTHSQNAEIVDSNGTGYGSLSYSIATALDSSSFSNITQFLDKVVVSMDSLVPYQTPGIRASFSYTMPNLESKTVQNNSTITQNNNGQSHHIGYILIAAFALLAILIWRIKKK